MIIFAGGVITGGLLVNKTAGRRELPPTIVTTTNTSPALIRFETLRALTRELGLTADQQAVIGKLIDEARDRVGIWMSLIEPETQEELKKLREEIRTRLTPQQRPRFEEMLRARAKRQADRAAARGTAAESNALGSARSTSP